MSKNQSLNEISSKIFKRLDPVLDSYNPDLVLVHGDTTTTLSAAISAFHKKIKIGHVEAGLRTKNYSFSLARGGKQMPYFFHYFFPFCSYTNC